MTDFLLTIITVTKNCADSIERTLESVSAVKRPRIEYLVVDGVSTDATLEAVRARGQLVDRVISEPDDGIYQAMNKGVGLARGRYVLFINGDDTLVAEGFTAVMDLIVQGQAGIICATTLVGNQDSPSETLVPRPWLLPFFNSIPHPSTFVPRAILLRSPFREDLRIASDYDFFLGAYLAGESFRALPLITALHQRGGASGNVQLSGLELERIRHQRLGWRYPFVNALAALFRSVKHATCVRAA
jgi:glycosyltransferase involved in cell wall biosynthesis